VPSCLGCDSTAMANSVTATLVFGVKRFSGARTTRPVTTILLRVIMQPHFGRASRAGKSQPLQAVLLISQRSFQSCFFEDHNQRTDYVLREHHHALELCDCVWG